MRYETRVVAQADRFNFECACGFRSYSWPLKKLAAARGQEHTAEHDSGEPMRELVDFREEAGLNGPKVELIGFEDAGAEE